MALKKSELYSSIWQSCDELRGGMDASQYKDYVLVLLFVRYVSDKYAGKKDALVDVPKGGSFEDLVKLKGKPNIGEGFNMVLSVLAKANGLKGVIDAVDFNDEDKLGKGKEMQERLSNLINIFQSSDLDFSKNQAEGDDLLGDAYEYLMKHFAVDSGKSKGQFYTPSEVSTVIAKVIGAKEAKGRTQTVYDPTCGSGSLLLKVAAGTPKGIAIFGQEKESATATLAILNMWLHGEPNAVIVKGQSTLSNPLFVENGNIKTFDYVVANPPFSYKAWRSGFDPEHDLYGRFEGFGVPPKKNGDFAFLLHIVKSLKSTGKGAVILPHGVLFRGNAEGGIRANLIQRGYIKGVIGLPPNMFYGTGIPACIIIIDKENAAKRAGIFIINASKGFIKDGNKNRLRDQDMRKIVDTWEAQADVPKYSRFVPNEEIKKNDYNLNIPRYIDTQEPEDIQDIQAHLFGGIPNVDIDALNAYWRVCPTLKKTLFKPSATAGYRDLSIQAEDVRKTIFVHPEFGQFRDSIVKEFKTWRGETAAKLSNISTANHPKEIIQKISSSLLEASSGMRLVNKYDIYQCLMTYWEQTMQDDTHIITTDGWGAGNEVIRIQKESKGKNKNVEGLSGLEGRLIPTPLLIKLYFSTEQNKLDELNARLEQIAAQMDELKDEYGGDEGLLAEVIDNEKISKGAVQKRIKEVKGDVDYADELKVLEQYFGLFEKTAEIAQQIKDGEKVLEQKVITKYPSLSHKDIKGIVVDHKWMDALEASVIAEVDRLSQGLAGRLKELAERYRETLPQIEHEVEIMTAKIGQHLESMGFSI